MALYGDPFSGGSQGGSFYGNPYGGPNTSFTDFYYDQNPTAGYRNWLNQGTPGGYDPYSAFGKFAANNYGNQYGNYAAVAPHHGPGYTFQNYLDESGGVEGLQKQFRNLDPSLRGQSSSYGSKLNWIGF